MQIRLFIKLKIAPSLRIGGGGGVRIGQWLCSFSKNKNYNTESQCSYLKAIWIFVVYSLILVQINAICQFTYACWLSGICTASTITIHSTRAPDVQGMKLFNASCFIETMHKRMLHCSQLNLVQQ